MARVEFVPDLFGLKGLAQALQDREVAEEQRGIRSLQRQRAELGLERERFGFEEEQREAEEAAEGRKLAAEFQEAVKGKPEDMSPAEFGVRFYQERGRDDIAHGMMQRIGEQIDITAKRSPRAAADLFNRDLAPILGIDPIEHIGTTKFGPVFQIFNKETGESELRVRNETTGEIETVPSLEGFELTKDEIQKTPLARNLELAGFEPGSAEFQTQMRKALTNPTTKDEKKAFDQASKIRSEITKASDTFNKITDAFGRIQASTRDISAAGDLALIFNFMKMLDPGSVVRESEFATAENAAGVPDRVRNLYNKVLSGEKLGPKQRDDFINQANNIFAEAQGRNETTVDNFVSLAERFGLQREDVIVERGLPERSPAEPEPEITLELNFDEQGNPL